MGELGLDAAMLPWFMLVMFLCLPFAICLSLVLACLAVSDCGLFVLQASVSVHLGDLLSLGEIEVWRTVIQDQLRSVERNQKDPIPS